MARFGLSADVSPGRAFSEEGHASMPCGVFCSGLTNSDRMPEECERKAMLSVHLAAVEAERSGGSAWESIRTGTRLSHERRQNDTPTPVEGMPQSCETSRIRVRFHTAPARSDQNTCPVTYAGCGLIPVRRLPYDLWAVTETFALVTDARNPFCHRYTGQPLPIYHCLNGRHSFSAGVRFGHPADPCLGSSRWNVSVIIRSDVRCSSLLAISRNAGNPRVRMNCGPFLPYISLMTLKAAEHKVVLDTGRATRNNVRYETGSTRG